MRNLVSLIAGVLTPIAASAHPDHAGSAGLSLVHYVTDPFHIATAVLIIGMALPLVVVWRVRRRRVVLAHRLR